MLGSFLSPSVRVTGNGSGWPAIKPGLLIQSLDNVDLYSQMAEILKIRTRKDEKLYCAALLDLETLRRVVPYRGRSLESED